jgi:peptidoglycan/LPS O-acetylase OafA/YrhL
VRKKSFDHLTYRADIDGLRAVAILSVVAFHAWPSILPSGFVGVDIFFVISGFLISSIIFKAVDQDSFSFKDFYSRRIKRIFPALGLVFVACLSMGWFALFADEYKMLGKHVASGSVFISNFTLLKESGYFDPAAELKPLLHLWSLGIEEQFYIVWPLLIYAAAKLRINLLVTTIFLAVLSFGLNIGRIDAHVVQTFYSPITRIWELMLGALLAYVTLYSSEQYRLITKKFANCIAIMGLVLIVMALFLLNDTKLFPGWWAALPTIGGVLLIAAGPSAWVNRKVLASHPLVFIGLISYPLYLWHWPLLSFLRIIESSDPSPFLVVIAVLVSVLLAWLTYFLVEKRIRHHSSSWIVIGLVIAVAISGCIGKVIQRKDGLPDRSSVAHYKKYDEQLIREADTDDACLKHIQQGGEKILFDYCRASNLKSKKWIAIIGDSLAHVLFPGFSREFERRGLGTILLANSSCPPFIGTATGKTGTETVLCAKK